MNALPGFYEGPIYDMSPRFDQSIPKKLTWNISTLKNFLRICLSLVNDENSTVELFSLLEEPEEDIQQEKVVNHIDKIRKVRWQLCMNAEIGDYDMDFIILDLGSNVNILKKKTRESAGNPKLAWSPIQLRLVNQLKVLPIGWLLRVLVKVERL